jgi:hypothetical protein
MSDIGYYFVVPAFGGRRYNAPELLRAYKGLPHVTRAGMDTFGGGDSQDICVSLRGDHRLYVFELGEGQCDPLCSKHTFWGFSIADGGAVTALGTYVLEAGDPPPAWYEDAADCRRFLAACDDACVKPTDPY